MSRKLALIIGNSQYQDPRLAQLITPQEDVNDLADVLRAPDIGGFDEVKTLVNETDTNIRLSIEDFFADKKPDDLLVIYFSGHGVRDEQGQLYLAVNNTRATRLRATAIPSEFITGEMDRSRSKRQVLILDCCHSGAFAQGSKALTGESAGTGPAFEGSGYGRVVLTATDATQYAWEGDQVIGAAEQSVFTHFLIEGLRTGDADTDHNGTITLDEIYDYVYERVVEATPKQTPGKWSYKQQGDIVIAHNPHPLAKSIEQASASTPPPTVEAIQPARRRKVPLGIWIGSSIMILIAIVALMVARSQVGSNALTKARTEWNVIVGDSFDTNDNQWDTDPIDDPHDLAGTREIVDGKYLWKMQANRDFATLAGGSRTTGSDFYASVDAQQLEGSATCGYGLLLRDTPAGLYQFGLTDIDRQFSVFVWNETAGTSQPLIGPAESAAIHPGEVNKLSVIAEGPHYRFFINDQPVGEMSDDQWTTGNVTLFTQLCKAGDSAVIEFDNVELRAP